MENDNSGVVIGKRHAQCDSTGCGVRFVVESTGQHVEVEGGGCVGKVCKVGEAVLSDKTLSDPKKRDFINKTNAEILDDINKRAGAGTIMKPVKRLKGGETVITVKATTDPTKRTYKNVTDREVASMINQKGDGVALAKGGFVLGEKKFSDVKNYELTSYIALQYQREHGSLVAKNGSNMYMAKGEFYMWLYNERHPAQKLRDNKYDYMYFEKFLSQQNKMELLDYIWTSKYQQTKKGSEHLLGIIHGKYDAEAKKIIIYYATVRPATRNQGIMKSMITYLKEHFQTDSVEVLNVNENDFMVDGNYAEGGDVPTFMFDIKFVTWELSSDGSTKILRLIYDPDIAIDILTLRNGYLDSDWIRTDMFEQEPYKIDERYDLFKLRDFVVEHLSEKNLDDYRIEGLKYNILKHLELDKSAVSFRLNREMIEGGDAAHLTLKEIAEITGEPLDEIIEQVLLGIDEEKEHSPDIYIRKEIAKDHIIKSPYYYHYLPEAEEKGKVKKSFEEYTEPEIKQLVAANEENLDSREAEVAGLLQEKFAAGGCICSMMAEGGGLYDEYYYNSELKKIHDEYNPVLDELEVFTPKWNELINERDKKIKELKNRVRKYFTSQGKYISFTGDSLMVRSLSYALSKEMKLAEGGTLASEPEQQFEFTDIVPIESKIPSIIEDTKLILHKDEEISKLLGNDYVLKGAMEHNLEKLIKIPEQSVVHVMKIERPTWREDQETFHRAYSLTLIDDLNNLYIVHYKNEDDFFLDFIPLTREYYQNRVINFLKSLGIVYNNEKFRIWLRSFEKSVHNIYDLTVTQLKQIFAHLHNQDLAQLKEMFTIKANAIVNADKFAAGGEIVTGVSADPEIKKEEFYKEGEKNIRYKDFLFTTIKIQGKKILATDMPSLQLLDAEKQREYMKVMKAVRNVDFSNAQEYSRPTPYELHISEDMMQSGYEFSLVETTIQKLMVERGIEYKLGTDAKGNFNGYYNFYNYSDLLFFKNFNDWLFYSKVHNTVMPLVVTNEKDLHNIVMGLIGYTIDFSFIYEKKNDTDKWSIIVNSLKDYDVLMDLYKRITLPTLATDLAGGNNIMVLEKYYEQLKKYIASHPEIVPESIGELQNERAVFSFKNANDFLKVASEYIKIIKTFREGEMLYEFKENPLDGDVIDWLKQYNGEDKFLESLSTQVRQRGSLSYNQMFHARNNYHKERRLQDLQKTVDVVGVEEELGEIEVQHYNKPSETKTVKLGDVIMFSWHVTFHSDWKTFNAEVKKITKSAIGIQKDGSDKIVFIPLTILSYNKHFKTIIITNGKFVIEQGLDK